MSINLFNDDVDDFWGGAVAYAVGGKDVNFSEGKILLIKDGKASSYRGMVSAFMFAGSFTNVFNEGLGYIWAMMGTSEEFTQAMHTRKDVEILEQDDITLKYHVTPTKTYQDANYAHFILYPALAAYMGLGKDFANQQAMMAVTNRYKAMLAALGKEVTSLPALIQNANLPYAGIAVMKGLLWQDEKVVKGLLRSVITKEAEGQSFKAMQEQILMVWKSYGTRVVEFISVFLATNSSELVTHPIILEEARQFSMALKNWKMKEHHEYFRVCQHAMIELNQSNFPTLAVGAIEAFKQTLPPGQGINLVTSHALKSRIPNPEILNLLSRIIPDLRRQTVNNNADLGILNEFGAVNVDAVAMNQTKSQDAATDLVKYLVQEMHKNKA